MILYFNESIDIYTNEIHSSPFDKTIFLSDFILLSIKINHDYHPPPNYRILYIFRFYKSCFNQC